VLAFDAQHLVDGRPLVRQRLVLDRPQLGDGLVELLRRVDLLDGVVDLLARRVDPRVRVVAGQVHDLVDPRVDDRPLGGQRAVGVLPLAPERLVRGLALVDWLAVRDHGRP
jgi:hypothetical protein